MTTHTRQSLVLGNKLLALFTTDRPSDEILAELQAHPDSLNQNLGNGTPLYYACSSRLRDVVHYLLTHGADPNLVPPGLGEPAIVNAVAAKDEVILTEMLDHGADPRAKDVWGRGMIELARLVNWPEGERILRARLERA